MTTFNFHCYGHKNVKSEHKTTLEFTTEHNLSVRGDCIMGVNSSCNLPSLPSILKEKMKIAGSTITVTLKVDNETEILAGQGNSELTFSDEEAIIIRKSSFICPRTLMINSDKSASDISRDFVNLLKNPKKILYVTIQVD